MFDAKKIKTKFQEKVNKKIADEISTMKCEEHGETPKINNTNLDNTSFNCCCDSMRKIVKDKIREILN